MDLDSTSMQDLLAGYTAANGRYHCLFCDITYDMQEVFQLNSRFFNAQKMMEIHLSEMHISVFDALLSLDKKQTGLSDTQTEMLSYFYRGLEDKEIVKLTSANSVSTIRQHRFKLREKEKQAKLFLAIMSLLEQDHPYELIHKGAKQVDERYAITAEEKEKVLSTYFKQGLDGSIDSIPSKEKKKIIILQHIMNRFDMEKQYDEKEVNTILKNVNADYVSLRRYLIEYGFMDRSTDCRTYWVTEK